MEKNERLKIAYQFLKGKGIVHTQKDLAEKMGATPPNVSSAFNGVESVLTDKFLYRFNKAFDNIFNIDWLLLGVGDMLTPDTDKSIKDRLVQYLKYKNITSQQLEASLGYSEGFVDSINDKTHQYKIDKMLYHYPDLNKAWLLTGEGDMLQKNEALPRTMNVIVGIPLVSQYAYAGYLSGYGDPEYIDKLPRIDFTPDRHMTGNYIAFEVRGDSMNNGTADSYLEGELLICREVEPIYWKDSQLFINKRDFVIIHKEGILIKRIIAHDVENHTITIHSLNPMYQDEILDLADVRQIFSVVESRRQRRR